MKQLVGFHWYNPGATPDIIGLAIYWNGREFKSVIGIVSPSVQAWDVEKVMDWGAKVGMDAAISEIGEYGSVEDRTLWDKLLGERGAKSSP